MKYHIKLIAIISGLLLLGSSCNNFLDVHPKGEVLGKDLLTDRKGFENALYGVYASLRDNDLYGRALSYYNLDIMAQYFDCFGNEQVTALQEYNYKHSQVEESFYQIWTKMYANISNVNNIIENLENQSPQSLAFYNIYKGEALGLRAFMHFDLLRIFSEQITLNPNADGIPYRTGFSLDATEILKAGEVYTSIIQDLRAAEQLLGNQTADEAEYPEASYLKDRQIHFNLQAVQATLARAYLTIGNTDSALYYAREVIQSKTVELLDKTELSEDMGGILSKKETIFGIYSKAYAENTLKELYSTISYVSLDLRWDIDMIYQMHREGNDYRWDSWFSFPSIQYRLTKLLDKYYQNNQSESRPEGQLQGINLIRLPEMYYIAAECLLKKGNTPEATFFFNEVLKSRGLIPLNERVPAETLDNERITEERYKEFIGEGQAFFHMKRLNLDIDTPMGETIPASKQLYVIDIPEQEYDYRK